MKCEVIRRRLAASFDACTPLTRETKAHLEGCAGCARYRAELDALEMDLREAPAPTAPEGLAARVKKAVAEERRGARQPAAARWGAGLAACISAALAGWFYPLPWNMRLWWHEVDAWRDPQAWHALGAQMALPFREVWSMGTGWLEQGTGLLSPLLLWSGVGGAALVLVLFNAFEAHHLGTTAGRKSTRHARG